MYERSLAHTALISDDWRRSELRDKDGAHEVGEAIVRRVQGGEPTWTCSFGYDAGVLAPKGEALGPERPLARFIREGAQDGLWGDQITPNMMAPGCFWLCDGAG